MDIYEALLTRRTIHNYVDEPVDESAIDRALAAAIRAPNHKLTNPWRFTRIGPQARKEVVELGVRLKTEKKNLSSSQQEKIRVKLTNPAVLFAVSQVLDDDPMRRREDYAATACAIQNVCLSLWGEGIGSKWSTGAMTNHETTYQLLGIDAATEEIVGFLFAGVPAEIPDTPRLAVEDILRTTK